MRKTIVVLMALSVTIFGADRAAAFCGFYVAGADAELFNNATMVVMMREGTRTVLSMQNNYQGPPENFAVVVPVPVVLQEENVRTLDMQVFQTVDRLAAPRLVEYWEQDPCAVQEEFDDFARTASAAPMEMAEEEPSAADMGVTIEAQFTVGEYEIVILSAQDSTGLDTWLRQEEYTIPEGAEPVLRPYVEAGSKFFVAKVDVSKVRFENGQAMLSPLRFHYDTEDFSLPVRLGLLNSAGTQDLIVHILASNQRYETANYENVTIPTNLEVSNDTREAFGEFYAALFDRTVARNEGAVVTEYAWQATNCDPCPGPVLSQNDLMTLGGDVMPQAGSGGIAQASGTISRVTTGQADVSVLNALLATKQDALRQCAQAAVTAGGPFTGNATATLAWQGSGNQQGAPALVAPGGSAAFKSCVGETLSGLRIPPAENGQPVAAEAQLSFSVQAENPWELQGWLNGMVLTRLHARYSKEALGDDLVFRPAPAIVGGREFMGPGNELEEGAAPSHANNFQGRYIIRHRWQGPIACENPRRGIWGGPPAGVNESNEVRPALDLAFAPRGNVSLEQMVRQNVPEIGVIAQLTGEAEAQAQVSAASDVPAPTADSDGCDACAVVADERGPLAALGYLVVAALFLGNRARRRRKR